MLTNVLGQACLFQSRAHFYASILSFTCATLLLTTPLFASFYEANATISWNDKPMHSVDAYLLRDTNENDPNATFTKDYAALKNKQELLHKFSDKAAKNKAEKELVTNFRALIKKYTVRKVSISAKGKVGLNVAPETNYYLVVIKQSGLFKKRPNLLFWIQNFNFISGAVETPKEFFFTENNATSW